MNAITIITVCYNEEKNIARTIQSILEQTTTNFEYIICDGASKDQTVAIAQSFQADFVKKGVSYKIYSEKDAGIYDAMNKGIDRASGKYIWFLNAGDWLCASDVLACFVDAIDKDSSPAVYYSDYYVVERHQRYFNKCDANLLTEYMSVGHPAMVAKVDLMREQKFDTSFCIAADYNFALSLKMAGHLFQHLDCVATYFLVGGISTTNMQLNQEEVIRIYDKYGLPYKKQEAPERKLKQKIVEKILSVTPNWMWKFWCVQLKHRHWVEY